MPECLRVQSGHAVLVECAWLGCGVVYSVLTLTCLQTWVPWLQVAAGLAHTAILDTNGAVYTLGWNQDGQLGLGEVHSRDQPTLVPGCLEDEDAVQASPLSHLRPGRVCCHGDGYRGALPLRALCTCAAADHALAAYV